MEPDDLLAKLRYFLNGVTRTTKCSDLELSRLALSLITSMPAARDAVLEYFGNVFDASVKIYSLNAETDQLMNSTASLSQQECAVISDIHSVLCQFVSTNGEVWASIISSWSLQLLGQLSSRYSRLPSSKGLNETLHWWMSCKGARTLVDITVQCLHRLLNADTEACVSSLLDISVAHSPHFDWVVAHVGSCFSRTVITRVLSLGLKGLCAGDPNNSAAKLKSVVGILGHLGACHVVDIRSALLEMFEWALRTDNAIDRVQKQAVVPYLLHLASKSDTLLKALSADVLQTLDLDMLQVLSENSQSWHSYFRDDEQIDDLVVSLALRCETGAAKIITLLLEGSSCNVKIISVSSEIVLELLFEEIDLKLRANKGGCVPFLNAMRSEAGTVQHLLLCQNPSRQRHVCRLFRLMKSVNRSVTTDAIKYLLTLGTEPTHMSTLLQLVGLNQCVTQGSNHDLLADAIEQALWYSENGIPSCRLWENLATLLKYEAKCDTSGLSDGVISKAIAIKLASISEMISIQDPNLQHAIMNVLDLLPTASISKLPLHLSLRFACCTVKYFFLCIKERDATQKTIQCRRASDLLTKWCSSSTAVRPLALRELVESALFKAPSIHFGSTCTKIERLADQKYSLAEENYKSVSRPGMGGRESLPFWNRIVTTEAKKEDSEVVDTNVVHLIEAIRSCCTVKNPMNSGGYTLSLEAMIQVALLLVELISPNVMYNGLPWPDEDYTRVTIERDLYILGIFNEKPVAWKLLEMLARHQPALCYCSVLLRALTAGLISRWSSPSRWNVLESTTRLLQLMCLGQLLPPPLTSLHQVIPVVTPSEVLVLLRNCVWNYFRDHVPSPGLFSVDLRSGFMWRDLSSSRPPLIHTEPMRIVMLQNIRHFGLLYRSLFVGV